MASLWKLCQSKWAGLCSSHEQSPNAIALAQGKVCFLLMLLYSVRLSSSSSWVDGMSILTQASMIVLEAGGKTLMLSSRAAKPGGIQ